MSKTIKYLEKYIEIYLHEEETILGELLSLGIIHGVETVELSLKVTLEAVASINDSLHDGVSLVLGNSWSEWEITEVTSDTDTGGDDHVGLILWEGWAVELGGVHVGNVLVSWLVTVVVLNDSIEELVECAVRVHGTGVGTNVGVWVLATGEDASLERNSSGIGLVLVLLPNFLGKSSLEEGVAVIWEKWPVLEVLW